MANEKLQNAQKIIPWMYVIISIKFLQVNSHGRLIEPPSRASMWRYGFSTPPNYNDHELYCGGYTRQWQTNGGKCGICGDPWDAPQPRAHEAGGKYGQGIIVRKYKSGSQFTIRVELTANHRGYFEFKLCPNNMPKRVASQQCLDKYVLKRAKSMMKEPDETFHETRYYPGTENKVYEMKYMLPPGLTCSQCVLQWRYIAGNNWGMCSNGTGAVGCGSQEEFRSCADIAITGSSETTTQKEETTPKEKETTTPSIEENEIPDETVDKLHPEAAQAKTSEYIILLVSIMGCTLLAIVLLFVLLYFYYYHANEIIQGWWAKGGSGLRDATCWSNIKTSIRSCTTRDREKQDQKINLDQQQKGPVAPPRTKKQTTGFPGVPENLV